jgi:hypothetical protein
MGIYKKKLFKGEVWASRYNKTVQHLVLKNINDNYLGTPEKEFLDGLGAALIAKKTAKRVVNDVLPYETYVRRSLKYNTSKLEDFKIVLTQYIFKLMVYCMFYTR